MREPTFSDPLERYLVLRLLMIDTQQPAIDQLSGILATLHGQATTRTIENAAVVSLEQAEDQLVQQPPYIIVIDPRVDEIDAVLSFMERTRAKYPHIVWVLNTPVKWWQDNHAVLTQHPFGQRLQHYYRMNKTSNQAQMRTDFIATLLKCQYDFVLGLLAETTQEIRRTDGGTLTQEQVVKFVQKAIPPLLSLISAPSVPAPGQPTAFVSMPFNEESTNRYKLVIERVLKDEGYAPIMMLDEYPGTSITQAILAAIAQSRLFVADISDLSPNVLIEVGAAWIRAVPTVLIANRNRLSGDRIPFMLRNRRIEFFATDAELMPLLGRAVRHAEPST